MIEDKKKYLNRYNSKHNEIESLNSVKNIHKNFRINSNFKIIDEQDLDIFEANKKLNPHNNVLYDDGSHDRAILVEINKEDNEDEIKAFELAAKEYHSDDESDVIGNKRQRHDSDSEIENNSDDNIIHKANKSENSDTEKELDELLQDEDGDLILNETKENISSDKNKRGGIVLEINTKNKSIKKDTKTLNIEREMLKKQTIYRDELGRKVDKSETKEMKKKEIKKKNYDNLEKWAKGIKQKEEEQKKKEELRKIKDEPFARYDIDASTEMEMRQRDRFGDPMKEIIYKHNFDKGINTTEIRDININRGFYLPKCKFIGTPNRFAIAPGFRWDGVDRGTGFEKRYLQSINMRKAREEEYHKLRTEEM